MYKMQNLSTYRGGMKYMFVISGLLPIIVQAYSVPHIKNKSSAFHLRDLLEGHMRETGVGENVFTVKNQESRVTKHFHLIAVEDQISIAIENLFPKQVKRCKRHYHRPCA